jgi:hypothetical protein
MDIMFLTCIGVWIICGAFFVMNSVKAMYLLYVKKECEVTIDSTPVAKLVEVKPETPLSGERSLSLEL